MQRANGDEQNAREMPAYQPVDEDRLRAYLERKRINDERFQEIVRLLPSVEMVEQFLARAKAASTVNDDDSD